MLVIVYFFLKLPASCYIVNTIFLFLAKTYGYVSLLSQQFRVQFISNSAALLSFHTVLLFLIIHHHLLYFIYPSISTTTVQFHIILCYVLQVAEWQLEKETVFMEPGVTSDTVTNQ